LGTQGLFAEKLPQKGRGFGCGGGKKGGGLKRGGGRGLISFEMSQSSVDRNTFLICQF